MDLKKIDELYDEDVLDTQPIRNLADIKETLTALVEGELPLEIVCQICANVIIDPVECKECQYIICDSCAQGYNYKCIQKCK